MRFSKEEASTVHQALQTITSPCAHLELFTAQNLDEMVELFSSPDFYQGNDMKEAPDKERLDKLMHERLRLLLWRVFSCEDELRGEQVGFIGWNGNAGPAYITFFPTSAQFDTDVFRDAALSIVHAFFSMSDGDTLHIYLSHPIPEEIHDMVVEAGFDLWQEYPGVNSEEESTYIMERSTFQAYYLEDDDDEEEAY